MVQSTNFRLSTFRIRLELFHRGIHVVEHNHLAYIPEEQFPTLVDALRYRTDEYGHLEQEFSYRIAKNNINANNSNSDDMAGKICIQSKNGDQLLFGPVEAIR